MPPKISKEEEQRIYDYYLKVKQVNTKSPVKQTADELGIKIWNVRRAMAKIEGLCSTCMVKPATPNYSTCFECRTSASKNSSSRYKNRKDNGMCIVCGKERDPNSNTWCSECWSIELQKQRDIRADRRENRLCYYCSKPLKDDENHICNACRDTYWNYHRKHRNKNYFGGLLELVLVRDDYTCQICGTKGKVERGKSTLRTRLEVHHIHPDINTMEGLVTLCWWCHKAVTVLNQGENPEQLIKWWLKTYRQA